uniref:Uncharacterized protein n=1 Tax=Glossina pallidipes TaxID=7398 RepID=A0A1A9ZPY7_GLOPL
MLIFFPFPNNSAATAKPTQLAAATAVAAALLIYQLVVSSSAFSGSVLTIMIYINGQLLYYEIKFEMCSQKMRTDATYFRLNYKQNNGKMVDQNNTRFGQKFCHSYFMLTCLKSSSHTVCYITLHIIFGIRADERYQLKGSMCLGYICIVGYDSTCAYNAS